MQKGTWDAFRNTGHSWTQMSERARFCCPADLWDVSTQTNPEQSQEDASKCPDIVNPQRRKAQWLFHYPWSGSGLVDLGEAAVAVPALSPISEFPEAVGGMSRDAQPGKQSGNASKAPGNGLIKQVKGLHPTQQWPHKTRAGGSSTVSEENTAKSPTGSCWVRQRLDEFTPVPKESSMNNAQSMRR